MHDFRYVSKKEAAPIKAILLEIIHSTQNLVRDEFTFQYEFVGSASKLYEQISMKEYIDPFTGEPVKESK